MADPRAVRVVVPMPLDRPFDYAVPGGMCMPEPGALVRVPFGRGETIGAVWGPPCGGAPGMLKPISAQLDSPPLTPGLRRFLDRAAEYTVTPLGLMLRLATRAPGIGDPAPVRTALVPGAAPADTPARARVRAALAEHGDLPMPPQALAQAAGVSTAVLRSMIEAGSLQRIALPRDVPYPVPDPDAAPAALSPAQSEAAAALAAGLRAGGYATTLLQGVTGSGKTEVYLEAVAETLRQGLQALVLLPEIALTARFLARLEERLGAAPAEWHSGIAPAERRRLWRAAADGTARVVVGARSALFLNFARLGLIVVDEEHDGAYKQEEGVLYHARDMAVLRASIEGAQTVLASATPSLESWVNAETGRYRRLSLPERYGTASLPHCDALDLRREGPERGRWIAPRLVAAVAERLEAGEQALLFLNRRGYAPLTVCRACGHMVECPTCDARLVEHRFRGRLVCHICGHAEPLPTTCPACGAVDRLQAVGPGVERLAEEAAALFPAARIALLSSDTAESPAALRDRITAIADGEADIVIGTQLVAKGHTFPLLTLVGVIDADLGLQNADLRAAERTFQLIRQVSGRAGRADRPGTALIQTAAPDHPVMQAILAGDETAFLTREAEARQAAGAPPFGRLAAIIVSGPKEAAVWATAEALARAAAPLDQAGARLLGPVAAPIARIRGRVRVRMLVKAPRSVAIQGAIRAWLALAPAPSAVRVDVDIDPQSFL